MAPFIPGVLTAFQATIPDVLLDEKDYTRALSLSRLAYDLESLFSPVLAAALLTVTSFHNLFAGTALGFIVSAALVFSVMLPSANAGPPRGIYDRTTRGIRLYFSIPRLRGLLAINMAIAAAGALVIVNTVVFVQAAFHRDQSATALALAAFGGGSMLIAIKLPSLLEKIPDRTVMLSGACLLAAVTFASAAIPSYWWLVALWVLMGASYSMAQTPSGRLLQRSSQAENRPALFAAQFALSHACWLLTYPLAGWTGAVFGLQAASLLLALFAGSAVIAAVYLWPKDDGAEL